MSRNGHIDRFTLRLIIAFCACIFFVMPVRAQLRPDVLQRLKDATVLIKAGNGDDASTGSGFVVYSDDLYTLIATNAHVVEQHLKAGTVPIVQCVFNSGLANEKTYGGEIFSCSQSEDLAMIGLYGIKSMVPLEPVADLVPLETDRVYVAGFPYGEMLSVDRQNPNVTISETGITSVRRGSNSIPQMLQTSGGIDVGNSGGPVVNAEGRLVGISVAKVRESSIGFAIPAWKLLELMPPSMSDFVMTKRPDETTYRFSVNLAKPKPGHGATGIPELFGLRIAANQKLDSQFVNGSWTPIAGLKLLPWGVVTEQPALNVPSHVTNIDLATVPGQGDKYVFQWKLPKGFDEQTQQTLHTYSRPLVVTAEDIAKASNPSQVQNAPMSPIGKDTERIAVFKFNEYVSRCIPAGGGRYIVVRTYDNDIAVIDLKTSQQVAKINDPKVDFLVAGMSSVVAFNRTDRTITAYRLPDLQLLRTKPLRDNPVVRFADWGSQTDGPIAAIVQPSGAQTLACVLIDPTTGKTSRIPLDAGRGRNLPTLLDAMPSTGEFELRMNETGNVITMWVNNTSRPQVHVMRRGKREWDYGVFTEGAVYGYAGPTGKAIYSADSVLAQDLALLHKASICIPSLHDEYFLSLTELQLSAPGASRTGPITSNNPSVKHVDNFTWQVASLTESKVYKEFKFAGDLNAETVSLGMELDERFICVPQYNVLVAVLPEAMRGASERVSLFSLGERLPGVSEPPSDSEQAKKNTLSTSTSAKTDDFRLWTDASGLHTLDAAVVAVRQGYVKLKKRDGSTVVMEIIKLSKEDQELLNAQPQ